MYGSKIKYKIATNTMCIYLMFRKEKRNYVFIIDKYTLKYMLQIIT